MKAHHRDIVEEIIGRLAPQLTEQKRIALYESNVFARAKKKARREGIILRKTRPGSHQEIELGRYYAVNAESTFIEATHVRLEDAALELEVIEPGEQILPG
jgi:hypothetical protein